MRLGIDSLAITPKMVTKSRFCRLQLSMCEKKQIERTTAEGFLKLFNARLQTDFKVVEVNDTPDVKCRDSKGNELNLEITLTEDRPRDIQAALGRSDHRSLQELREHNKRVAQGKEKVRFSSLSGNTVDRAAARIQEKSVKRYGSDTALVVRDTSGVDWDWDLVVDELVEKLSLEGSPFDKGIWILNLAKSKLYPVVEAVT